MKCRIDGSDLKQILDLGMQPMGNGFATELDREIYRYPLQLAFSESSLMYQLAFQPPPSMMFHKNYAYYSSTSDFMSRHFNALSQRFIQSFDVNNNSTICEIGCNDGIFLANFVPHVKRCIGFEPSSNVGEIARGKGCEVYDRFFAADVIDEIGELDGIVDILYGANVICHIPDFLGTLSAAKRVLKSDGIFIFEEPYIGSLFQNFSYDQLYDEHVFIFGVAGVQRACNSLGLKLFHCEALGTHGGSMRYFISRDERAEQDSVSRFIFDEMWMGIYSDAGISRLCHGVQQSRVDLVNLLQRYRESGFKVCAYGATSKSTTVFNYCGIDSSLISCSLDTTPQKQGCYIPGTDIPVVSPGAVELHEEVRVFLGAWNHAREILDKESKRGSSCKWFTHVPYTRELS